MGSDGVWGNGVVGHRKCGVEVLALPPPLPPHCRCAQRGAASPCGVLWSRMDTASGWATPLPLPVPRSPLPVLRTPLPVPRSRIPTEKIQLLTPPSPLPVPPAPLPVPRSPLPAKEHHLLNTPNPLPVTRSPLPAPPPYAWPFLLSLPAVGQERSVWGRSFARLSTN